MSTDECKHGLHPDECSLCRHSQTKTWTFISRPFTAKYESVCRACNLPIYPGQQAVVVETETEDAHTGHEGCFA